MTALSLLLGVVGTLLIVAVVTVAVAWSRVGARLSPGLPAIAPFKPFFGNLPLYLKMKEYGHEFLLEWAKRFKWETFTYGFPDGYPNIVSIKPEVVKHILKDNFPNYIKGKRFRSIFGDMLGTGIFASDGPLWKEQRKAAAHMFSARMLRDSMFPVMQSNIKKLMGHLERFSSDEAVDMQLWASVFALDVICEIGFGYPLGSMDNHNLPYANAFDDAQHIIETRFERPFWKVQRLLGIGPEKRMKEAVQTMDDFAYGLIKERRAAGDWEGRIDLLSKFLHLAAEQNDPDHFDDKYLRDVVSNFMLAGRDTTMCTIAWCLHMIMDRPDVETALLDEMEKVVANHVDGDCTFDEANRLEYMHAFISETLRLYPVVPRDSVYAEGDDILPDGTRVRAGDVIIYHPYLFGRNELIWGEDALVFKPERWLDGTKITPYMYPVFNAGPRNCLGKPVAYLEVKLLLVALLARFRFVRDETCEIHYRNSITLPMKNGLRVYLHPRR